MGGGVESLTPQPMSEFIFFVCSCCMLPWFAYVNFSVVCLFVSDFCRGQNGMYVDLFARATKGNSYSSEIHPALAFL